MKMIKYLSRELYLDFKILYERTLNTIDWVLGSSNDFIILNVWLRHKHREYFKANWGDDLNEIVVSFLSERKVISYMWSFVSFFRPKNYMCIGSIVDTKTNRESIIWGSGAMYGDENIRIKKPYEVCAVRGPRTRRYLIDQGINCPEIYGDPAIFLPFIYKREKLKKYKLGIIPHYIDYNLGNVQEFVAGNSDVAIINMKNYERWQDVVDLICSCEFIASSSLHGIIISDSYNVPNIWIRLSNMVKGGDFKFLDYLEGCGRNVNSSPLDFSGKEINYALIIERMKEYKKPEYNLGELLRVCHFVSLSKLDLLNSQINGI